MKPQHGKNTEHLCPCEEAPTNTYLLEACARCAKSVGADLKVTPVPDVSLVVSFVGDPGEEILDPDLTNLTGYNIPVTEEDYNKWVALQDEYIKRLRAIAKDTTRVMRET